MKLGQRRFTFAFWALAGFAVAAAELAATGPTGLFGITLGEHFDSDGWELSDSGYWTGGLPPIPDPRFERYDVETDAKGRVASILGVTGELAKDEACASLESIRQEGLRLYGPGETDLLITNRCGSTNAIWCWEDGIYLQAMLGGRWSSYFSVLSLSDSDLSAPSSHRIPSVRQWFRYHFETLPDEPWGLGIRSTS